MEHDNDYIHLNVILRFWAEDNDCPEILEQKKLDSLIRTILWERQVMKRVTDPGEDRQARG